VVQRGFCFMIFPAELPDLLVADDVHSFSIGIRIR
jgi:hypothetical protein